MRLPVTVTDETLIGGHGVGVGVGVFVGSGVFVGVGTGVFVGSGVFVGVGTGVLVGAGVSVGPAGGGVAVGPAGDSGVPDGGVLVGGKGITPPGSAKLVSMARKYAEPPTFINCSPVNTATADKAAINAYSTSACPALRE